MLRRGLNPPYCWRFSVGIGSKLSASICTQWSFYFSTRSVDELGNPLTISNDGQDALLTINFATRGYGGGELGTGRSFVQANAEYRFPIFSFNAFEEKLDVGETLFVDYVSDLGSGDTVIGEPAVVRDKPGHGLGYGAGLRTLTPIGIVRLEVGFNDQGDSAIIFNIGDRF